MKSILRSLIFSLLLGAAAVGFCVVEETRSETSRVTVLFSHPEKFTDVKDSSSDFENERGRERYLPQIQEYLAKEANRLLRPGQKLTVVFSDIDLAGDFEPWLGFRFDDVRIVRDRYIPRLTFSFKLTDDGGMVLKEGERKLAELTFQLSAAAGFPDDQLRYEKSMLNNWLRQEFVIRKG